VQRIKNRKKVGPKVDLCPATHLLDAKYEENLLYAICLDCGRENTENVMSM
jgi:hypothetical protein